MAIFIAIPFILPPPSTVFLVKSVCGWGSLVLPYIIIIDEIWLLNLNFFVECVKTYFAALEVNLIVGMAIPTYILIMELVFNFVVFFPSQAIQILIICQKSLLFMI